MRATLSIRGLLGEEPDLFKDHFFLPAGVDYQRLQTLIEAKYGELEILYPNPLYFGSVLEAWSLSRNHEWGRMITALTEEYNPLHNYDRHEEWTDDGESHGESSGTKQDYVAGFNDQTNLAPSGKTTGSGEDGRTSESSHEGHIYGNIGVVSSAQMLSGELEVRKNDIYNIICTEFKQEFLLMVY